ncbi:MAG: putative selenate ABC transporter substrate-binding protein [Candidatus Methylomirabilis oxygeniifera]|uniref:ABC phosphonate-binding periplasmic protein n=1 Tax=Methylomirabilis oxygeniifera TaxID=671143 RepID=D5MGQ1_METO1|nr:MAG: putative selenate ABC transporter substrate-binding protein [Candidatus Methylomirabilis oxyfera]CBE68932.1 ABC phosphonate-binding periplasmic protein precursor [Candidatus Methylomirabilis oxyfera]
MGRRWTLAGLSGVIALVACLGLLGPAWSETPKVLRVSAIPDENPTELMRIYTPFAEYLSKELGIPVKYIPVVDYAATVEALAAKKLDMVWYGGFTFVQARKRTGNAIPVVSREEDLRFHSKFITRPDTGIKTLADLKGKSFSFGSVSSTSGHLMPRYFLLQNGIDPEKDFATFSFSGAHDATALWVESGKVDAGALNEAVWDKLVQAKKVDLNKVQVFWTTPPYIDYVWTVRGDLDSSLVEKIAAAFTRLNYSIPADKALMDLQRTKRYVRVKAEQFKPAEEAAIAAGLLQ